MQSNSKLVDIYEELNSLSFKVGANKLASDAVTEGLLFVADFGYCIVHDKICEGEPTTFWLDEKGFVKGIFLCKEADEGDEE